jgi:hypothetical protein
MQDMGLHQANDLSGIPFRNAEKARGTFDGICGKGTVATWAGISHSIAERVTGLNGIVCFSRPYRSPKANMHKDSVFIGCHKLVL